MPKAAVNLPCYQGGRTVLTMNICGVQTGSNTDRYQWRVVRRDGVSAEVALLGTPDFILTGNRDVRSWTWIDGNVPETRAYDYVLQIKRVSGGGTAFEVVLLAQHFKR